jgi:hypothetical protein
VTSCGLRTRLLQSAAATLVASTRPLDVLPCMRLIVGVGGKVNDTKIDSEDPGWAIRLGFEYAHRRRKTESAVPVDEGCLPPSALYTSTLLATKPVRNKLATLKYKQNYPIQRSLEGHYPLVLAHRAMWTERQLSRFILPIDISYLRNAAPRHLRGKLRAFPNLIVEAFLQLVLRGRLVLESFHCYPVSRFAEAFDHPKQGATLLLGKFQFDHDGQLHASIILHHTNRSPPKRESSITRRLGRSFHLPARLKRDAALERLR